MCSVTDDAPNTLQDLLTEIQALVETFDQIVDPEVRRNAFRLLDLLDVLHRQGLERLVGGLASVGMLEKALDDPIVAHLLSIYGLVAEEEADVLVQRGLDEIRGYVQSHGGDVTLDRIDGGTVHLHLLGACVGCPSSEVTIGQAIEEALRRHWPGLVRVDAGATSIAGRREVISTPVTIRSKPESPLR